MRRTVLYIIIYMCVFLSLSARDLTFRGESLATALATLRDMQTEYTINFIANDLESLPVHVSLNGLSMPEAIKRLCSGLPVKAKIRDKQIFIQYDRSYLAKAHHVAVWVPSQGNKQIQDRSTKITMSNMSGGAWKGYTAQIIIAMQKFMEDMSTDNTTIQFLKNRYSNNFTPIGIEFNNGTCRFGKETTNTDAIFNSSSDTSKRIADIVYDETKGKRR